MKKFFWSLAAAFAVAISGFGAATTTGTGGSGRVTFYTNTVSVASQSKFNIIAGSGISFLATNNAGSSQVDILLIANPAAGTGTRFQTNTVTVGTQTNLNLILGPNVFFRTTNNTTTGSADYYIYSFQTNFSSAVVTNALDVLGASTFSGPFFRPVAKTPVDGTIPLTGTNSWTVNTNDNTSFSLTGTATNGQRLLVTVSNYNPVAQIIITNLPGFYDQFARSNRTTWIIESNSITTLGFTYHTNLNNGLWVLDSWSGPEYALAFGSRLAASTNGATREITVDALAATNVWEFAFGETNVLATGTGLFKWRAPYAMTVVGLRASLSTVSSSGIPTVDINESGTTIISTKLTIDASELTSTTAATPYVLSDTAIADDAEITFDIDVAGTGAAGLKVKIYTTRP
jgi:hypothetical protein